MNKLKLRAWDDVLKEMLYSKVEQFDDAILFRFEKHFETEKPVYLRYTNIIFMNVGGINYEFI